MLSHYIKIILWLQCCPSMEEYPEFYYPDAVSVFNNEISERYLTILEYTEGDVLTFSGLQMYLCLKNIWSEHRNTYFALGLLSALCHCTACYFLLYRYSIQFIPTLNNQTQYYFRNPAYFKRMRSTLFPVPSANNRRWNKLSCV